MHHLKTREWYMEATPGSGQTASEVVQKPTSFSSEVADTTPDIDKSGLLCSIGMFSRPVFESSCGTRTQKVKERAKWSTPQGRFSGRKGCLPYCKLLRSSLFTYAGYAVRSCLRGQHKGKRLHMRGAAGCARSARRSVRTCARIRSTY